MKVSKFWKAAVLALAFDSFPVAAAKTTSFDKTCPTTSTKPRATLTSTVTVPKYNATTVESVASQTISYYYATTVPRTSYYISYTSTFTDVDTSSTTVTTTTTVYPSKTIYKPSACKFTPILSEKGYTAARTTVTRTTRATYTSTLVTTTSTRTITTTSYIIVASSTLYLDVTSFSEPTITNTVTARPTAITTYAACGPDNIVSRTPLGGGIYEVIPVDNITITYADGYDPVQCCNICHGTKNCIGVWSPYYNIETRLTGGCAILTDDLTPPGAQADGTCNSNRFIGANAYGNYALFTISNGPCGQIYVRDEEGH